MPQENFRSVVYRSFVTCDDPKGVVEAATIRKSKAESQKMVGPTKTESERQQKTLIKSSTCKEDEDIGGKKAKVLYDNPSSFQLLEVKKGAQKLNQVIDSWSKGVSFEGKSKDIAKDLLKGALDLQESLSMLGKLQETSQYMARLKKQKEKVYEMGLERTGSERFENRDHEMSAFRKPRISVDGSSRDCYEELRDVIRDSLGRQNLLPTGSYEHKVYHDRRKIELSPDMPSTSSSRSSIAFSYEFASTDSVASKIPEEKLKGSNLVAKLMGLEERTSKSLKAAPQKHLEIDTAFTRKRPIFDIDLPMTRKPQFVAQKVDREPMTMDKIIEALHSKRLMRSNNHQNFHSYPSYLEKRFGDDTPPIVLMKPHRPDVFHPHIFHQDSRVFVNGMAQNLRPEDDFPPRIRKVNSLVMQRQETFIKKLYKEKGGKDFKKDFKEKIKKSEHKEVKITGKMSSPNFKVSVSASPKPQKSVAIEKKIDKIQKLAPTRKKPVEMHNVKPSSDHKPQQEKATLSTKTKPEARSNIVKSRQISPQKPSPASPVKKSRTTSPTRNRTSLLKSSDQNKIEKMDKPVSKPLTANVEKNGRGTDNKQIDISCENESDLTMTDAAPAMQNLYEGNMDAAPAVHREELSKDNQHSLSEATRLTTEHDSVFEAPEEVYICSGPEIAKSSSLNRIHDSLEIFDIDAYRALVLQTINIHQSETDHSKLIVDYVNEMLEQHKSLRQISDTLPLFRNQMIKSRICVTVDQLTKEISDGLENLGGYCKCMKASPGADTMHGMLEKDLWWKGGVGGAWDMGWRDSFSLEEVEEVVGDLDKLLLTELIENVITDFLCLH